MEPGQIVPYVVHAVQVCHRRLARGRVRGRELAQQGRHRRLALLHLLGAGREVGPLTGQQHLQAEARIDHVDLTGAVARGRAHQ